MATLRFIARMDKTSASKSAGVNGLTVTWDIEQITKADGTRTAIATGAATNITIGRRGLYGYLLTDAYLVGAGFPAIDLQTYDYIATAITSGDVDASEVSAMWWDASEGHDAELANLDAAITSRSTYAGGAVASVAAGVTLANDAVSAAALSAGAVAEIQEGLSTFDPETDSVRIADPLLAEVPGSYASGTAGAALGRIGRGTISTVAPTAQNGDVTTYQGAVYLAARGTALEWTDREAAWPDLTDATIKIYIEGGPTFTGEVITPTGAGKKIRQELAADDSEAVEIGRPRFQAWAEWEAVPGEGGGEGTPEFKFPLVEGVWNSKAKCTPAAVES